MSSSIQIASQHGNSDTTFIQASVPLFTTVNATPSTFFSISVTQSRCVYIDLYICGIVSDFSSSIGGNIDSLFLRGTSSNILQQGSSMISIVDGFAGKKSPVVNLSANTVTNSIDVVVTGLATTTINWTAHYNLMSNA